jgi:hypothetical protein
VYCVHFYQHWGGGGLSLPLTCYSIRLCNVCSPTLGSSGCFSHSRAIRYVCVLQHWGAAGVSPTHWLFDTSVFSNIVELRVFLPLTGYSIRLCSPTLRGEGGWLWVSLPHTGYSIRLCSPTLGSCGCFSHSLAIRNVCSPTLGSSGCFYHSRAIRYVCVLQHWGAVGVSPTHGIFETPVGRMLARRLSIMTATSRSFPWSTSRLK